MKKNKFVILIFILASFLSCKKDPTNVGVNIQPANDILIVEQSDSTNFFASTILQDSISTDERSNLLFGRLNDPDFGITTANFATQFRIEDNNLYFGTGLQADSMVLYLDYSGYYGDTTIAQHLQVYKLNKKLEIDSTYYSTNNISSYYDVSHLLADITFTPSPNDTALAIRFSTNSLIDEFLSADTSNFRNNDNFSSFFNGLAIVCDSTQGQSIIYFNSISGKSLLRMYYSNSDDDSLSYDFIINNNAARFNTYTHNYSNTEIATNLNDSLSSKVYIQSAGGVKLKLKFELPQQIMSNDIAINKAQLILTAEDKTTAQTDNYPVPEALLIELIDDTEGFDAPIDYYLNGTNYFDGQYNSETNTYTFNLTRYIQKIITNQVENNGFYIIPSSNKISANRLILLNSDENKIKFKIYYTKLNK